MIIRTIYKALHIYCTLIDRGLGSITIPIGVVSHKRAHESPYIRLKYIEIFMVLIFTAADLSTKFCTM